MNRTPLKRGKGIRKKSNAPNSIARRVCDYLWGTIIILRDKYCVYCGLNPATEGHHIFCRKDCPSVRYSFENGIGLDGACHKFKAHGNPEMYRHINIKHVGGQEKYDELKSLACLPTKNDYKLIEIGLWEELKRYEVFKPDEWDSWKEYKKMDYLRKARKTIQKV
jgi:hypothetical protein